MPDSQTGQGRRARPPHGRDGARPAGLWGVRLRRRRGASGPSGDVLLPPPPSGSLCRQKVGPVGRWETRPGHASVKVIGHSAEPVVKAVLQNRHCGPAPGQMTGLAPPAGRPHSQALQTLPPATHTPQVQPARLPLALVQSVKVTKARQAPDMLRRIIINFTGGAKTKTKTKRF